MEVITILKEFLGWDFALVLIVFVAVYKVTQVVTKIRSDHNNLTKIADKGEKNIEEIRRDLSYIKGSLDILMKNGANNFLQSQSPISVTEEGKRVASELKAEEIISRNWDIICHKISELESPSPYDIQQYCLERIAVDPYVFFDIEDIKRVKDFAFSQGKPLQLYLRLLGILVRDKYFEEKNIPISSIDEP
ncbi:hypothetical protein [Porphyromonas canoris]|nr:hypothetical protein [Porphyromonas canoris]